ncbi:MAG TPA: hypothetical protein PLN52_05710, partial [Opitutaceae bacterium]|nr:hypothetical protein [Opitutaceae bacterium]
PLVTSTAERLPAEHETLVRLLTGVGEHALSLLVTLQTVEACHVRGICPRIITSDDGVLTLSENLTWVQLALSGMQAFAVDTARSDWPLTVVGPGNTCLLALTAREEDRRVWKTALRSTFSILAEGRE